MQVVKIVRLSHSSVDIFQKCKRWYYLAKIKKVIAIADDRHMRRGSCFHDCAEWISKNDNLSNIKQVFEDSWNKNNLSKDFQEEHDSTYLMVLEFMNNKPETTSIEFEIYRSEPIHFVSYLDSINTHTKTINDYKTSTFGYETEPYKEQMKRYALMYRYKLGHKPERCIVWFVKYSPIKKIEYIFDDKELDDCEKEILEINDFIEKNKNDEKAFSKCTRNCHIFCPYMNICDGDDVLNYRIEILGSKIKLIGAVDDKMDKVLSKKFSYELKDAFFIKKKFPMANTTVMFWNKTAQTLPIGFMEGC
jgi:PD-(D/E)XK nuclease superfamily